MPHGTFGWEKFAAVNFKSVLESTSGLRVTAQVRTSGPEKDWVYLTARTRTAPLSVTVIVLSADGNLLGHATAAYGEAAYKQARTFARTATGIGPP